MVSRLASLRRTVRGSADVPHARAGARPRIWNFLQSAAACAALLVGACVAAPTSKDWLEVGFQTPLQALRTFQTAVRAEEPDLELRCFSVSFRERNHISRLTWREFLDELERREPWLRKGIADAEISGELERRGTRARIHLVSHGIRIEADLVLEDSGQVWAADRLIADEDLRFSDPEHTGVQTGANGERWMYGRLPLPADADLAAVTELRLAREWKIDGIENLGEASSQASIARSPPR
jgi:hypothetical protein